MATVLTDRSGSHREFNLSELSELISKKEIVPIYGDFVFCDPKDANYWFKRDEFVHTRYLVHRYYELNPDTGKTKRQRKSSQKILEERIKEKKLANLHV